MRADHPLLRPAAGLVSLCLLCGVPLPQAAAQPRGAVVAEQREWLLSQVRVGEATGRVDLVQDSLARLRRLAPDDRAALLAGMQAALRLQQPEEAESLFRRLQAIAPDAAETRQAMQLWELYEGSGRELLQQAQLLSTAGRRDEAIAAYEKLFGTRPPDFATAADYWRLRAAVPGGRRHAIARLQELDRRYPGNPALRQNLVQLLFAETRERDALALLHRMAEDPGTRDVAARRELDYLADQPPGDANVVQLRAFIDRYQQSPVVADAQALLEQRQRLVADPGWRAGQQATRLLERDGDPVQAEALFRQALRSHPQDAGLLGGMGQALARQGRRDQAIAWFQRAVQAEQDHHRGSKWRDLERSTRYWLQLGQGEAALEAGDIDAGEHYYRQALQLAGGDPYARLGLAAVADARGDTAAAERELLLARRQAPGNADAIRRLAQLYARQGPQRLQDFMASLEPAQREQYAALLRDAQQQQLQHEAEQAEAGGDPARARALLERAADIAPDDIWLTYRLAGRLHGEGRTGEADARFARLLQSQGDVPAARYAQALFLSSSDRDGAALEALAAIDAAHWSEDMHALSARLQRQQLFARARALREDGDEAAASALLRDAAAGQQDAELLLADWAAQRRDWAQAHQLYAQVLARDPANAEARLGQIEVRIGQGDLAAARRALEQAPPELAAEDVPARRRLANAWAAVGERGRALAALRELIAGNGEPDALLYRDAARLMDDDPQQALDTYALAMRDNGLLSPNQAQPRDDRALTLASRESAQDDWLRRSLRSDVEALYQRHNPTLTVLQDSGRRSDGTPGISRLARDTRIVHLDAPFAGGLGFARIEQVRMDARHFRTDADGIYDEDFGTCDLDLVQADGTLLSAPSCDTRVHQRLDSGAGLALGWRNLDDTLRFDLGHTPGGYPVGNWLGGIGVGGDLGVLGWSATASRRPMTNSLLSQAGAVDPRTGLRWGGVTANGATFSLGYDQGGRNGIWSNWSWHRLRGENVLDNERARAMAGWYHKLIQRPDMRLDVGLSAMYWRYRHDLGGYSLGQGGYYSPQRYTSIGLPVSFAWRNDDWSLRLDGSLSASRARSDGISRFPDDPALQRALAVLEARYGPVTFSPAGLESADSTSSGSGYRLYAAVERRLGDHFVLGAATTLQRSRDYAPNSFQLYLRYALQPWRGNLPLPVRPLEPYGEFR